MSSSSFKYEITTLSEFSAAHKIEGITGPCSRLHGHNWKLETTIGTDRLDHIGFSIDFYWLDKLIQEKILSKLDHTYLNEDHQAFKGINPTCERVAQWCFEQIEMALEDFEHIQILSLSLWENSRFKVTLKKN